VSTVSIRYIADNVDAAVAFYCENLGFTLVMHPAPALLPEARLQQASIGGTTRRATPVLLAPPVQSHAPPSRSGRIVSRAARISRLT
jgi:catechol 2,3-dioxygenase-like lactoylglutathione lyase family enzyme